MTSRGARNDDLEGQIVDFLCRRGWRQPVLIGLEVGQPLTFLGAQLLWIMQPVLGLLLSRQDIGQFAKLLEDTTAVDSLITRLERVDVVGEGT